MAEDRPKRGERPPDEGETLEERGTDFSIPTPPEKPPDEKEKPRPDPGQPETRQRADDEG